MALNTISPVIFIPHKIKPSIKRASFCLFTWLLNR
nr:MAG TPA: hypothetical protein [Caudoviricetes sp.]DAS11400.1 MAG TPA: hypothetical protein [Caudoviricetes sp.]